MKLKIKTNLQTAVFFEMYHSIAQSYGIKMSENNEFFETKEFDNNLKGALAILSLDELLTRHLYPSYETANVAGIENFTEIEGEADSLMKLLNFISQDESSVS